MTTSSSKNRAVRRHERAASLEPPTATPKATAPLEAKSQVQVQPHPAMRAIILTLTLDAVDAERLASGLRLAASIHRELDRGGWVTPANTSTQQTIALCSVVARALTDRADHERARWHKEAEEERALDACGLSEATKAAARGFKKLQQDLAAKRPAE